MPTQRQLRVGEEIRHALAGVFLRGDVTWPERFKAAPYITVTEVQVSPDLRNAYVYIVPMGGEKEADVVKYLNDISGFFRHILSKDVKLRYAPVVRFKGDSSFDYAEKIEKILHEPKVARDLVVPKKEDLAESVEDE